MTENRLQIVVLDGFTLNPGDLSWDVLNTFGDCTIYDRTDPVDVVSRAKDAAIVFTNKTVLDQQAIKSLPNLRFIQILATGYNIVDIDAASKQKIVVSNVPGYGTNSVAQATFALLLELTNHVGDHNKTVHDGRWMTNIDYCYWDRSLIELNGLTMGIIGLGTIGEAVSKLAEAFGMKVIAYSRSKQKADTFPHIEFCTLDEVFKRSDVISLHCPLTPETEKIVNADSIALMKPSAFLLNTSRGPLVDELALSEGLKAGRIAGAGLDVLTIEPPRNGSPLFNCRNCIITPHNAWATHAARQRLLNIAINNLTAFLAGMPANVVSSS